jgi:CRISPR-associated protein Cmr3
MPQTFVKIRGIDPLLFRDGRPFTNADGGLTAVSVPLPRPTTLAGFVRTQIGNAKRDTVPGWKWDEDNCKYVHDVAIHGPLLMRSVGENGADEVLFSTPLDAIVTQDGEVIRLTPDTENKEGGGCDLPEGLLPLVPARDFKEKPGKGYHYWTKSQMMAWLEGKRLDKIAPISGLPRDERVGIAINDKTNTTLEGMLYTVQLRGFEENNTLYSLLAKVKKRDEDRIASVGRLGGEQRLTSLEECLDTPDHWPRCHESLKAKLANTTRIKLTLATPAVFTHGWKPEWVEKAGKQTGADNLPGGFDAIQFKLIAAAVGRREAISGWCLREGTKRNVRWMVPAGSTYFFEVTGDTSLLHEKCWLKPVSDTQRDRTDGLGLALWGTWDI